MMGRLSPEIAPSAFAGADEKAEGPRDPSAFSFFIDC
jgi:hypothetical protein